MSFSGFPVTEQDEHVIVENDGFWPAFDLTEFMQVYRLPAEYAPELVADHVRLAIAWANGQLAACKAEALANGHTSLVELPAVDHSGIVGGESVLAIHYRRAVSCQAKALLLAEFMTINRREAARNEAKEGGESRDLFLTYAEQAIADFLGSGRVDVELI